MRSRIRLRSRAAIKSPSNQSIELSFHQGTQLATDVTFASSSAEQTANRTPQFALQWLTKFVDSSGQPCQADHADPLMPGILIISGERINFIEQSLRGDFRFASGEINATIAAKESIADDGSRHGLARNACQQRGFTIAE